ncbi:hypothetical protein [Streptomyces sp. NPDC006446]|uniref:hypothetical protein n=1 Tax=Streptomyces sp. NPDC006446 TaxID=3154301 RepID=UPI0033BA49BB
MTTADHRSDGARGAVLRWTGSALITLLAALVLLVHHETADVITHVPSAQATAGMHHSAEPAIAVHTGAHAMPSAVTAPAVARDDDGACCGTAAQHCSAAGVDGLKFGPPHQPSVGCTPALPAGAAAGRDVPGTTSRAPPDLSVLSRLLL